MKIIFYFHYLLLLPLYVRIVLFLLLVDLENCLWIVLHIIQVQAHAFAHAQHSAMLDIVRIESILHTVVDAAKYQNCEDYERIDKEMAEVILVVLARPED